MTTPLVTYSVNELLFAYQHAARFRSPWIFDPSAAFLAEADIWNLILNDWNVAGIRQQRNQSIVRPWRVQASPHAGSKNIERSVADNSKRLAALAHEALWMISGFDAARFTLSDAFFLGRRYAEIEFCEWYGSLDGTPPMTWYVPFKLVDVDRRRFHWVPDWSYGKSSPGSSVSLSAGQNAGLSGNLPSPPPATGPMYGTSNTGTQTGMTLTGVHLEMFSRNDYQWHKLNLDQRRMFVEYVWDDTEDRLGHGRGALESFFHAHYWWSVILQKAMEGIDRFANGTVVATLDSLRAASTDQTNANLITQTQNRLQAMRSKHVYVQGEGDKFEIVESTGSMLQIAIDFYNQLIQAAERYANGSIRPSGMGKETSSGRAATEAEADTSEAYYQFAREDLDSVLDRDLLGSFLYFNEANLQALGLGLDQVKRPKFSSEQIKRQAPKERLETLMLLNSKGPVLKSEMYEAAEATNPSDDDDVFDAQPQMMGIPGEFGGGPMGEGPKRTDKARDEMKKDRDAQRDNGKGNGSKFADETAHRSDLAFLDEASDRAWETDESNLSGASIKSLVKRMVVEEGVYYEKVAASRLLPPHKIDDIEKLASVELSIKEKGWQGRPLLVYPVDGGKEYQSFTGSHRIYVARELGMEVPILCVRKNDKKLFDIYDPQAMATGDMTKPTKIRERAIRVLRELGCSCCARYVEIESGMPPSEILKFEQDAA